MGLFSIVRRFRRKTGDDMPRKAKSESEAVSEGLSMWSKDDFTGSDGREDHWRDVMWVYNNLYVSGVKPSDAPSPGAWGWLMECRGDAKALNNFRAYYMKLAPSRKELDERARRADGGESVLSLLDEIGGALS